MPNKILLADDSITIQKVVNLTFTDEGINVVTVGNGELALKKLSEEAFDLVLADIFMPGRNGYEVCEFIKSNPAFGDVPVILLVGAFEPFDKSEAQRVRADGHLTKPFESRILIETVKRMLAEAAARKAAAEAEHAGAYKGTVVGWDVPTARVDLDAQQFEDAEPEPPSYDPYASTAKLPMMGADEASRAGHTMAIGSPVDALSSEDYPSASPFVPSKTFDYEEVADTAPAQKPLAGPPDSVSGFSYKQQTSGPLSQADGDSSPFGYRDIHSTDSPLDLPPDLAVVEQHAHEPAHIEEVRDPLLETFADVSDTTSELVSPPAPGLEVNVHAEGESSMNVLPSDDITSTWDPAAQPPPFEARAEPEPEQEPEPESLPGPDAWHTQAYPQDAAPFSLPDEPDVASEPSNAFASWTPEVEPPPAEAAPEEHVETPPELEVTADNAITPQSEFADEAVYEEVVHAEPVEEPVEEPVAVAEVVESVAVAEAVVAAPVPANGSGASHAAIPQEIMDEIVRRTVERMSDDVIREIAWDVVPELAEQIIRKRLSGNG